jgi:general secretion pathway protein D
MKRKNTLLALFFCIYASFIFSEQQMNEKKSTQKKLYNNEKKIRFNYTDKPLVDVINELAAEKKINVVLPQGAAAIPHKLTYNYPEPLTINQAWKMLISILDLAGFTSMQKNDMVSILKIENIAKQPLSIYIDEPLENLPNTETIIKAIFYLKNINIKVSGTEIKTIIQDMLSPTASIILENKTNALIITDKSINIKDVMKIIVELDKGGIRDSIEVLPLYYTSAQIIDDLFNKQLLAPKQQPQNGAPAPEQVSYFPKNTKILGLERKNALIIMGTPYAIDLVKDFIIKYIDRPLESGESILHIYELQYLKAEEFAPVLRSIVTPAEAPQAGGKVITGPKQYFKDVLIEAEKKREADAITPSAGSPSNGSAAPAAASAQVGGNRLIIAARKKDWIRIKKLIEDLDQPQLQVALEVLVFDITLNNDRALGSQMRDKQGFNDSISARVNFQTAHLNPPILRPAISEADESGFAADTPAQFPANALMSNLLQVGAPNFAADTNLATALPFGSLVFSLKDSANGGVWSVWQMLNRYATTTILAQPFVVTKNHQKANVSISTERFLIGNVDASTVAPVTKNEYIPASLIVDILPRISKEGNINLQIVVTVNQFTVQNSRATRLVQTNSNVGNGEILALGGLTRERDNTALTETPPFSKIPILGWFFKSKAKVKEKNNLVILISPTIIRPRLKGGIDHFSQRKLDFAQGDLDEHLCYENLRDPITRWFFKPDVHYAENTICDYTQRTLSDIYENKTPSAKILTESTPSIKENEKEKVTIASQEKDQLKELIKDTENPLLAHSATQEAKEQAHPQL